MLSLLLGQIYKTKQWLEFTYNYIIIPNNSNQIETRQIFHSCEIFRHVLKA